MLTAMYNPRGYFYYRRTRYFTTRIPYMRWSQAWAFRALAQYLGAKSPAAAPAALEAAQPQSRSGDL
jgi:hypothetical protein